MSENINKDKIENLDSLMVKRSNFNIVNFIIHKEMKLFLYILLFLLFLLFMTFSSLRNIEFLRDIITSDWIALGMAIFFILGYFLNLKIIDKKMDKILKENGVGINDELKIKWWWFFLNPFTESYKLNKKINMAFEKEIKKKYNFENFSKDVAKTELGKRIKKTLSRKTITFALSLKNGGILLIATSFLGLINNYYSNIMTLTVNSKGNYDETYGAVIRKLTEIFLENSQIYLIIAMLIFLFVICHRIFTNNILYSDELAKLYDVDDFLNTLEN